MNRQTFYLVWGEGTPHMRHDEYLTAKDEAERLARLHPGIEFVVVKAISGHCYKPNPMIQTNYGNMKGV